MEQFSKMKPKNDFSDNDDEVVFDGDYMKIIKYEDWNVIKEKDLIVCIPYLIQEDKFILRHEYVPSYKMGDNQEYHLTVISGGIEQGETPEKALFRELEEEAGIVVRPDYKPEMLKPLFICKSSSNKYYPCIMVLSENDYHEVVAKGDGSREEKLSKSVKVDIKFLKAVNSSDVITDYLIEKLKKVANQQ